MTQYNKTKWVISSQPHPRPVIVIQNDLTTIRLLWLFFKVRDTYINLFTDSLFDYGIY